MENLAHLQLQKLAVGGDPLDLVVRQPGGAPVPLQQE